MEFRKILALRGPNYWANFPVLEAWVDLGDLKDSPSDELPGFNERLMAWLPSMIEHRCSEGVRGGFFERLRRGTYQAHILEHVTLELQSLAGSPVGFGRARETTEEGVYKVAIEFEEEAFARACLYAGREMCQAAVHGRAFDVESEVRRLRKIFHDVKLGPSTGAIVAAAHARGIPTRRLNGESLILLGHGARQRRISTAETDLTGAIAESIAQDKELTRDLLRQVGVPVPEGRPVVSVEDAWEVAEDIGGPVVVKPRYGNHGRGVTTNLSSREQVAAAYMLAREESRHIVVERFATGFDYRLLVVGGKLIAAARREPAQVVGDGVHTVTQLIEEVNRDPRRGDDHATVLTKIVLDPIALTTLTEQGVGPDSISAAGQIVVVRRNANLSTGGSATDVTDLVHPDVVARAIDAAQIIGLDIAGVDVIARDISLPLEDQGGVVVEVNAGPGLRMHLEPSIGKPRPVGEAIIDTLFSPGETGRIPIVAVTGVNGKTTTTRLVAHMLKLAGHTVGLTCTEGIDVDGRQIDSGDCSGPRSAKAVLLNPKVTAAALETARGGVLREGLAFDLCDVGIVTNIGEGDHLGLSDIETVEKLARVKRCVIDVVAPWGAGVLKADDPLTAAMASACKGQVIFFCRDADHAVVAEHRAQGGKAVLVRDGQIVMAEGADETPLMPAAKVPLTYHGRVGFQVENVLAAVAAGWGLNLSRSLLVDALTTFVNDPRTQPARFNVLHHQGATVIVDYGHNPSALLAIGEAIAQFPHERRAVVFSAAGDRRDEDIIRQGAIVGDLFDDVVIFEDACNRGREDGVCVGLLREGLSAGHRVKSVVETRGEENAVTIALRELKAGDLLIVQADQVESTVAFVQLSLENRPANPDTEPEPVSAPVIKRTRHEKSVSVALVD
jgi:cyanophycin synthetase